MRLTEANKNNKMKNIMDFDEENRNSIKSSAIKNTTVNVATRFMKGKLLMFSKVSLQCFHFSNS